MQRPRAMALWAVERAGCNPALLAGLALLSLEGCGDARQHTATGAVSTVLTRVVAARALQVHDSLWMAHDVWAMYPYPRAAMSCEDWRGTKADNPIHRAVDAERLIAYVDSSSIGVDSVSHACIEQPTEDARSLELTPGVTHLPNLYLLIADSSDGRALVRLRTHRARLDSVTGIVQAPGAAEADVEFTVRQEPTAYAVAAQRTETSSMRGTARLTRYDDGWRVMRFEVPPEPASVARAK